MSSNPPSKRGILTVGGTSLTHQGPDEHLIMNKYHVLLVIERLMKKPSWPNWEHILIPFGLLLGTLFSLLTATFQDYLGVKASVWEAFALFVIVLSGITTVVFFLMWLRNKSKNPTQTAEQIVENICAQMDKDQERAAQSQPR